LIAEWRTQGGVDSEDPLMNMFEFARRKLYIRDGCVPSRRASIDSSSVTSSVPDVIRQVAEELKKEKSETVSSFIREWIDVSDDPHGVIFDTASSGGVGSTSPISSSSMPRSSLSGITPMKDTMMLESLTRWETDFLALSSSELLGRSIKIFDLWGFFGGTVSDSSSSGIDLPQALPVIKSREKFGSFLKQISKNYKSTNPYHNFHHAHSVLAIVANLIRNCVPDFYSPLEEFGILVAAVCHDVGHRGLNSDFYIKTRHELAIQYNDISVLENMHCSLSFEILLRSGVTADWSEEEYTIFRKFFIQSVLATDMKQHFELTGKLGDMVLAGGVPAIPELVSPEDKRIIYCSIVHAADLANPTMPTKACYNWAVRVVDEMYAQGKLEEKSGFTVAPFMRHPPTDTVEFAKLQLSFLGFIVSPLWKAMAAIWPNALDDRIRQLEKNNKFWENLRDQNVDREQLNN